MEKYNIYLVIMMASPFLWLVSVFSLRKWEHFWKFFFANLFVLVGYFVVINNPNLSHFGHDEYGLNRLVYLVTTIIGHVLLGFLFAVGYYLMKRKSSNSL